MCFYHVILFFLVFLYSGQCEIFFKCYEEFEDTTEVRTSRSFPRSWLISGFVTRLTRRVSLVEQKLLTLPEHLSSLPVFSGIGVTQLRYILHMQVLLECCYIWMESSRWENWNHLFCRKVSVLTAPHCQFRGVGQGRIAANKEATEPRVYLS
jgi:hypothetical protein